MEMEEMEMEEGRDGEGREAGDTVSSVQSCLRLNRRMTQLSRRRTSCNN